MLKLILRLCVLTIGLCYATSNCHDLQKSQLASLNDRITQMLNTLYTSPLSPKTPSTTSLPSSSNATPTSEYESASYEPTYYPYPGYGVSTPQVIYVTPSSLPAAVYGPPPKPSVAIPPTPSPLYHLESHVPIDPYRSLPAAVTKPLWSQYYDHPLSHLQYPQFPPMTYTSPNPVTYPPSPFTYPPLSPATYPPISPATYPALSPGTYPPLSPATFSPPPVSYSPPPPVAYSSVPSPYPATYPYSWDYNSPYPEYATQVPYPPKPLYSPPLPSSLPPQGYITPTPIPYPPPPLYPKHHEIPPPPPYYV